jgi:hypothetical protein
LDADAGRGLRIAGIGPKLLIGGAKEVGAAAGADRVTVGQPIGAGDRHVALGGADLRRDRDQIGIVGERDLHRLFPRCRAGRGSGGGGWRLTGRTPMLRS